MTIVFWVYCAFRFIWELILSSVLKNTRKNEGGLEVESVGSLKTEDRNFYLEESYEIPPLFVWHPKQPGVFAMGGQNTKSVALCILSKSKSNEDNRSTIRRQSLPNRSMTSQPSGKHPSGI